MRFVYLVDDDADISRSVRQVLGARDILVRFFPGGGAFLDAAGALEPGVLLLELATPGPDETPDGTAVLDALRVRGHDHFVTVMLTGTAAIPLVVRAMKAGAIDLVPKPFDAGTLLVAVDEALSRLDAALAAALAEEEARAKIGHLSGREYEVLKCLVDGLANKVTASTLGISSRTVEIYRANLMRKLGVRNLAQGIRLAFAAGWGLDDDNRNDPPGAWRAATLHGNPRLAGLERRNQVAPAPAIWKNTAAA